MTTLPTAVIGSDALFPALQDTTYLAHASISPISQVVRDRLDALIAEYARGGMRGMHAGLAYRERLPSHLGELLGLDPAQLLFTQSTTTGLLQIARSIPWEKGQSVVIFEGEFPTNTLPWRQVARDEALHLERLPIAPFEESVEAGIASLAPHVREGTRVCVSAVQFQTGLRMPIEAMAALCRSRGAELIVDMIQAAGSTPIDLREVDYLACGGHKWLQGIEGAGFLFVSEEAAQQLRPSLSGWLGRAQPLDFLSLGEGHMASDAIQTGIGGMEQGTQSMLGLAALEASTALLAALGVAPIFAHIDAILERLEEALCARGFESARRAHAKSGILSVRHPRASAAQLASALEARNVIVTTPDGWLRFAPHWCTREDVIEDVISVIDESGVIDRI